MKSRILIGGCFRSGTTYIVQVLNKHPQLLITNELGSFGTDHSYFIKRLKTNPYLQNAIFAHCAIAKTEYEKIYNQLINSKNIEEIHNIINNQIDGIYSGDKMPHIETVIKQYGYSHYNKIWLSNGIKDALFIYCLRDPRGVILSQLDGYNKNNKIDFWAMSTIKNAIEYHKNWYTSISAFDEVKNDIDYIILKYDEIETTLLDKVKEISCKLDIDHTGFDNIMNTFNTSRVHAWREKYPDMIKYLPLSWIQIMEKYDIKI